MMKVAYDMVDLPCNELISEGRFPADRKSNAAY